MEPQPITFLRYNSLNYKKRTKSREVNPPDIALTLFVEFSFHTPSHSPKGGEGIIFFDSQQICRSAKNLDYLFCVSLNVLNSSTYSSDLLSVLIRNLNIESLLELHNQLY